jgi:cytochrome c peroxidase
MKKIIIVLLLLVPLLFLFMGVINLVLPTPPSAGYSTLPTTSPEQKTVQRILGAKCMMCHCKNPALPFYAQLPLAGTFIQKHIKEGTGMMNLQEVLEGTSKDRWALDRLTHAVTNDTMPIQSYLSLHWNGKLTEQEQTDILAWIEQRRSIAQ